MPFRALILLQMICLLLVVAASAFGHFRMPQARVLQFGPAHAHSIDAESRPDGNSATLPFRVQPNDAATRQGFEDFYNMDYAAAIALFQKERERYPDDPFVVNHLLAAVRPASESAN